MKKLISIVCVVLVVFCMMNVFEEKPQALVVDSAFWVSVIGSVLLSVAVSEGIALATGGESVYTGVANALWDYFVNGEAAGDVYAAVQKMQLYGSFVYQGGKFYFALNQNGYNFFKSWLQGIDYSQIRVEANLNYTGSDFPSTGNYMTVGGCKDFSVFRVQPGVMTTNFFNTSATYTPGNGLTIVLNGDGTIIRNSNCTFGANFNNKYAGMSVANSNGLIMVFGVYRETSTSYVPSDDKNDNRVCICGTNRGGFFGLTSSTATVYINDNPHRLYQKTTSGIPSIYIDDDNHRLAYNISQADYNKKCYIAGCLLAQQDVSVPSGNSQVTVLPGNTNSDYSTVSTSVEFEEVAPAIPNNTGIGRNQVALIPVPGNTVDSEDESIILSPSEVKEYDREGKDYTFIPVPGQLQGKTGADLGVTIMNETTLEETSTPVYTGSVPDVFPTASPDVTITAGADVFPTVAPTEAPTAGEGSTADVIAGDIADIKDEVGDLSTPLTPPQAQDGTNKLKIPQLLLTKFPFCIPYDFYNAINQFNAEAEMPSFDIPFHFAQINFDYTMHIDFERFTTLAKICQWFFSVSWVVILILLTRKVIWK